MAAVLPYLALGALGAKGAVDTLNAQESLKKENKRREDEFKKLEAERVEQEKIDQATLNRNVARQRQRGRQNSTSQGRGGTILTSSLGDVGGQYQRKTLLGA